MRYTTVTLQSVIAAPSGATEFVFAPQRPLAHAAGQAGLLIVPGGGAKPFTLASDDRSGLVSIATNVSGSRFKQALAHLRPGDRAHLAGAIGAPIASDQDAPVVAIAQGIGITPYLALARSRTLADTTLLQVGTPHYFDEIAAAFSAAEHHARRDELEAAIARMVAARPTARWTISGRSDFATAIARRLIERGVSARRIHKDAFWTMRAPRMADSVVAA